jgi:hypothetical protein
MRMEMDKEELEDFNQMIRVFVLFYKTIWSEVEKQFSELPIEERHKIYGVIAPLQSSECSTWLWTITTQMEPAPNQEIGKEKTMKRHP